MAKIRIFFHTHNSMLLSFSPNYTEKYVEIIYFGLFNSFSLKNR